MAGETAVETPVVQDNKIEEVPKSDKEAIVEEEKAAAEKAEEKKDVEKKEEKPAKKEAEKPKKLPIHKQDFEEDVVYMYQFFRTPTIPSLSPFCLKVESYLKMHGIKYENVDHKMKLRSKKGMLPFVELNGEEIGDSNHIIEMLAKKFEKEMPAQLTPEQKNVQHAMISMVENHFYWTIMHWKVSDMNNMLKGYKVDLPTAVGSKVPPAILNFYFKHTFLRKGLKKVKAQGLGTAEEIETLAKNDMQVLSDTLGDKEFFFGDEPSLLDLIVFSHLAQVVFTNKEHPCSLRDHIETECKNLVGLVNRMKDRCWGDHWETATGEACELNPHIPKPVPVEPAPVEEKKEEKAEEKKEDEAKESSKEAEKKEEEKEKADEKKEEAKKEESK